MNTQNVTTKRDYKSSMFTMIFSDKKELLELYNAVANRNYTDPELLTINTLKNAIYMSIRNDLSFIIDSRLSLFEHQSTYNPNMPLRFLLYLADLYSDITKDENLYSQSLIPIPAPRFIVFYNGQEERPDRETLCLSDAYITDDEEVSLELKVDVLNINIGHNKDLLNACKTLRDYSEYVSRVRQYAKSMDIKLAVDRAIDECIREDILREFLSQNKAEAIKMSIYEYDQEKHMKMEREEHYTKGLKDGITQGIVQGREEELANTERERQRADDAEARADDAEARADDAETKLAEALEKLAEAYEKLAQLEKLQ